MAGGLPSVVEKEGKEADELLRQIVEAQKASENIEKSAPEPEKTQESIPIKSDSEPKEQQEKIEDENTETWKHKYDVLIGKYNAEIPRISHENKELKNQITELQNTINDIQTKFNAKIQEEKTVEPNKEVDLAISIINRELGTEVSGALSKLLDSKTGNIPKKYEEKVSRLEKQVKDTTERQVLTEKQAYNQTLNRLIPNLIEKNKNTKWLGFLSGTVPFSGGKTYQDVLNEANNNMDALRVAEIFDAFYNPSNGKKHDIEEILEPGKPKPNKTTSIGEKKIYSQKEIDEFYLDVRRGKYTTREAERMKIAKDIDLAATEGRIR